MWEELIQCLWNWHVGGADTMFVELARGWSSCWHVGETAVCRNLTSQKSNMLLCAHQWKNRLLLFWKLQELCKLLYQPLQTAVSDDPVAIKKKGYSPP